MDTKELANKVKAAEREAELALMQVFSRLATEGVSIKDFSVGGTAMQSLAGQHCISNVHVDIDVDWRYRP